ncbi:MAG: 30S ribosomal protein S9 [Candidatus Sungbacteria bacterium]|uniref:Small ribosomal subunit protein uS9 n=1 Tax=Candidatus Sungiibacteriota bacterium TaxID=2750080 RepID=A0A932QYP2_9BACT|nr:30S ribosomal protein S9 [Candidatus Sungbacteria bacterium]
MPRATSSKKSPKKAGVRKATPSVEISPEPVASAEIPVVISEEDLAPEAEGAGAEVGKKSDRYFEAVGRRKTAVARARLFTRAGDFSVNNQPYTGYFPTVELQRLAEDALKKMKLWERFRVSVKTSGGGKHAQAEAVRHALARCLIKFNPDFRKRLKRAGFLTRDPRMKERKKFGLKKARRAPQWQKR